MPRKRRLSEKNMNAEQMPRRGTRNRTVKQRPDFIDPFSLRKRRKMTLEDTILSPISSVSDASSSRIQDDGFSKQIEQIMPRVPLVYGPIKKRTYMRVTWSSAVEATPKASVACSNPERPTRDATPVQVNRPIYVRLHLRDTKRKSTRKKQKLQTFSV